MERQLSHAVRLVDDLLDTSRINRDALELRLERCELAAVVSQALETVRPFVESGAHRLEVSLPEEPVTLRADPVRLAQVLSNLIHNACKFSDPGRPVAVSARKSAGWIEISVRDEGIGFAPEDRDRLFEMFTQLDPARSRSRGGLGVGLSIVRRLVEMHGGRVEASSGGPGRGSEFRVSLPELALSTSAAEPFLRVPPRAPAAPRRILVVDDNADSASSLAALLELSGNDVRTAGDGLEAVGLAEEFSPDVVLLDIGLPGIDGYEAARRIRALPRGRMMLLVAVTGWGQSEDRRRSREAGFDHHMVKPLRASALETLLANFSAAHAAETREPGADASPTT
jgi:CheY-like chemotaxis protein